MKLSGQVALITGAGRNIGKAMAKLFASEGAKIAVAEVHEGEAQDAAIDLYFREKAFWTFGRGQRLGDLRRLVRQYNRTPANVFPTGDFFKGGQYGSDMNLPIPQAEFNNQNFKGCLDRSA